MSEHPKTGIDFLNCEAHPDLPITSVCMAAHPPPKTGVCCQKCIDAHTDSCLKALMVPVKDLYGAIKPIEKTKAVTRELTDFIQTLRAKFETFLKRLTEILDALHKLDQGDFMNLDFDRLTEALVFKGYDGHSELEVEENTAFFKKLQSISQQVTVAPTGFEAIPIDPTIPPEGQEVRYEWRKKTPEPDEKLAQTMEMFIASRLELRAFRGSAKLDIINPEEMAIKYSGGCCLKLVIRGGYRRILLKIKYSLTPKKEVLQFYLIPKSHLAFLESPEVNVDEVKALSFIRLETYYTKNTKQVHDRGMTFAFEQSKDRLLLLMNDRSIVSEGRVRVDQGEEYLLVMSVVSTEPNNMYLYIENKYIYKPG